MMNHNMKIDVIRSDQSLAILDELSTLPLLAKAEVFVREDLGDSETVVHVRHLDVLRPYTGHGVSIRGGLFRARQAHQVRPSQD